ncbi:MAG: hypothetical protein CM1200mP18_11590 [Gammaproteobacteria bacterium]|nr:MAG: hypothetical protein CM1200mP18_11590 [Gammaproteobacteria bacterium]
MQLLSLDRASSVIWWLSMILSRWLWVYCYRLGRHLGNLAYSISNSNYGPTS